MNCRLQRIALLVWLVSSPVTSAAAPVAGSARVPFRYLPGEAFHILPETTSEESGYFSLCEGRGGKIYVGTAKYNENAFLVEFDPQTGKQRIVLDTNKVCGLTAKGYAAQSKLHTRNFVGLSGRIYVGSKQGYRRPGDASEYPGGYVMTYDPATGRTEDLRMPHPQEGVIDVVADERRGKIYVVTCEQQHWILYDVRTKKYRELGPRLTPYATTLVDRSGRANALTKGFRLARYKAETDRVTVQDVIIDGKKWSRPDKASILTWCLAEDGRTAYAILMNDARLIRMDLSGDDTRPVRGVRLGMMVKGPNPDCRCGLTIGPRGRVFAVVRVDNTTGFGSGYLHHLACFDPKTGKITDLGVLTVKNPNYYQFTDAQGKPRPHSHGFHHLPDNTLTPLHHHMALIVASDGTAYVTVICPFTLLKVPLPDATAQTEGKPR